MKEQAVLLGARHAMVGILTDPAQAGGGRPAVLILNSGIVHRVGPSRLSVKIARDLAGLGFSVMRFDGSGIGDSDLRRDNLPHEEAAVLETREAMDYFAAKRDIDRFVLMGICSGAVTSFKASVADPRVVGAVMINPRGFNDSPEWNDYVMARGVARDYWKKVFRIQSWLRLVAGQTQYGNLLGTLRRRLRGLLRRSEAVQTVASDLAGEMSALLARRVRLLLVFSSGDYGVDYVHAIMSASGRDPSGGGLLREEVIHGSDHTFTCLGHQEHLRRLIAEWTADLPDLE